MKRVVITGVGAICPLGGNVDEIWSAIIDYKIGYKKYNHPDPSVKAKFFGRIEEKLDLSRIPKRLTKMVPRFAEMGLIAADQAMEMANSVGSEPLTSFYSPFDCGVIFGTGWGGQDSAISNYSQYSKTGFASPFANLQCMPSVATGCISINWNLRGYQNTPAAACATGSISIGDAYEVIRSGRAEMMLAGGAESVIDPYNVWTIDMLNALTKEQNDVQKASCPFSSNRTGFVLTEGAAVVCLESLENAKKRNAPILAEIVGFGSYSDAQDMTAPAHDGKGRIKSIEMALHRSKINPDEIDYINAHGTSTQLNDKNETEVIKAVFGEHAYNVPISSTKSYTGHLISAAGALETILCIRAIKDKMIPATINYHDADLELDLNYVPNKHMFGVDIKNVLNVNYGFGGCNSALILRRYDEK